MKNIKRIIAAFLALLMMFSALAIVASAEEEAADEPVYEFNTGKDKPAMNYLSGEYNYTDAEGNEVTDIVDTKQE